MDEARRKQLRSYALTKLAKWGRIFDELSYGLYGDKNPLVYSLTDEQLAHYVRVQKMIDKGVYKPPH